MLEFVRRNRVILTSGFLLFVALLMVSRGARSGDRSDVLGRVAFEVMRPFQGAAAAGIETVNDAWRRYVALVGVREENDRLRRRLEELERQAVRLTETEQTNRRLNELLGFRSQFDSPAFAAQIIGRDALPWFGTVTIGKGEADGVNKGMAVLSPFGVVGRVIATSAHAARVLLLTDHSSGVDALVQRTRARGIVEGSLDGHCVMKYVKREEDIDVGDRVVTSGLDGIFPKGVLVGEVVHVTRGQRGLLQAAEIRPAAPLESIEDVVVVSSNAPPTADLPKAEAR